MPHPDQPPLYVADAAGVVHRVYDVRFGPPHCAPGRRSGRQPPDPAAMYRAFVTADGARWLYRFAPDESRLDLAPETLARQRRAAEWAPTRAPAPRPLVPGHVGG
jgi:hypothetical protein